MYCIQRMICSLHTRASSVCGCMALCTYHIQDIQITSSSAHNANVKCNPWAPTASSVPPLASTYRFNARRPHSHTCDQLHKKCDSATEECNHARLDHAPRCPAAGRRAAGPTRSAGTRRPACPSAAAADAAPAARPAGSHTTAHAHMMYLHRNVRRFCSSFMQLKTCM